MSSNVSSPYLEPTTGHTLAPPSPSPLSSTMTPPTSSSSSSSSAPSVQGKTLDDDIPPLSLDVLTAKEDKVAALKLVADSIAQQRQQASSHLIYHPLNLSALAAALAIGYKVTGRRDPGTLTVLFCGIIMTYLLAIRYLTGPYIRFAEELKWSFIVNPDTEEEDIVLGTKFGGEVVGALVLRLEGGATSPSHGHRKKGRGQALKGGKGVIRAWTTRLRYRGKGVGGDLLREAVRITKDKCGRDAEVGFAREHANGRMVLPEMYNGVFRKREMRAARALEGVLGEWDGRRKR